MPVRFVPPGMVYAYDGGGNDASAGAGADGRAGSAGTFELPVVHRIYVR